MSNITFVFRHAPHATSAGREGVDAVLATSALTENISVVFIDAGVGHIVEGQNTDTILSKNYAPMIKLFELYDIDNVYVCSDSLQALGLEQAPRVIDVKVCDKKDIMSVINSSHKILAF